MSDIVRLSDDTRRQLCVVVGVALMAAASTAAGVLAVLGLGGAAQTALAIALATSFPVLAGAATVVPTTAHRTVKIALAGIALVALLSLALTQTPHAGA